MRILVTGGAGFVGSHLYDALERQHEIVGIDNLLTGNLDNRPDVRLGDVTDRAWFYAEANRLKPELVIHCAASYSDPDKWHLDTKTNVEGGINAALVARHHDARLFYFQTILPPVSSYAISKIASEQYQRLSGVPLTVFRMANIYGPRNMSGPVPVFYKRLMAGQPCTIVDTTRDMVYISDLVRCVKLAVDAEPGTYDVCSGVQTSINTIYETIRYELGKARNAEIVQPLNDDVQGVISALDGLPGWSPQVTLVEGIAATVGSYLNSGVGETFTHLRLKG